MDRGKLKLNHRVGASTILEVIIAMVLILVVFTIAMMISANVMRSSLSVKQLKAEAVLQDQMIKVTQNPVTGSAAVTMGELRIIQDVKTDDNNKALVRVKLSALDANLDTVAILQKICPTR